MPEPENLESKPHAPIGEVILGQVDPRTLTKEEFNASPDLLTHIASGEVIFNPEFVYVNANTPYSATVGEGLYTTNDKDQLEKYAIDRARDDDNGKSTRIEVLPYRARMFDFRSQDNLNKNAGVPFEIFKRYVEVVKEDFDNTPEDIKRNLSYMKKENHLNSLTRYLEKSNKEGYIPLDLREMMGRGYTEPAYNSSASSGLIRKCMLSLGYDGLIYGEGGDGPGWGSAPTHLFFKLDNVSDYDSWQLRKTKV